MTLKPQDIIVALKLFAEGGLLVSYVDFASDLGMSAAEVHGAVKRLVESRLIDPENKQVRVAAFRDFLIHGVPYVFPAKMKEVTRGIPTGWAAPAMAGSVQLGEQLPPVWPDPEGEIRGAAVRPLYPSAPHAARKNSGMYSFLALIDALRLGRARERLQAQRQLEALLPSHG